MRGSSPHGVRLSRAETYRERRSRRRAPARWQKPCGAACPPSERTSTGMPLALRSNEVLTTLSKMSSAVNGSVHRGVPAGDAAEGDLVEPAWREHFRRVLSR